MCSCLNVQSHVCLSLEKTGFIDKVKLQGCHKVLKQAPLLLEQVVDLAIDLFLKDKTNSLAEWPAKIMAYMQMVIFASSQLLLTSLFSNSFQMVAQPGIHVYITICACCYHGILAFPHSKHSKHNVNIIINYYSHSKTKFTQSSCRLSVEHNNYYV